jgi:hypothetical protein
MRIRVERSGGLAGIPISNEIDAKDLPYTLVTKVRKLVENAKSSSLPLKATPKGAADHYLYKFTFQDGTDKKVIEFNQYNVPVDLKFLISYIEKIQRKSK